MRPPLHEWEERGYNVTRTATSTVDRGRAHKILAATHFDNVIFFDPDTGLLPTGRKAENAGGEEYATIDEVLSLCRRGQSVVCVQFGAPGNFEREPVNARQRLAALRAALVEQDLPEPWGLWWRDQHTVGFIVAPAVRHAETLAARRAEVLADPAWSMRVSSL